MEVTPSSTLGRIVAPAGVRLADLSPAFAVDDSLVGEVVRIAPSGGVLVNLQGQHVLLELGQQMVPGQTFTATVIQVVPTLMLQLAANPGIHAAPELPLPALPAASEAAPGLLTAAQLKDYLAASQPFGQTVARLAELVHSHPFLHDSAPALLQELQETLAVLQSQGQGEPDAAQLKAQVDRSGLNYENKVQRALAGEPTTTAATLAQDLKGQLLALSHRLEQQSHSGTAVWQGEAAAVLEQVKQVLNALELQQLANQFALQEHHPLVLPLVNPFGPSPQTTQITVHRDGGKEGQPSAEQERYTVTLSLDLSALGPLHIAATVQGSEVSATFHVEDPAVAAFLRAATPELQAQLQALGLQALVACEVQKHVAQDHEIILPHLLTRAVRLVDVTI